MKLVIPAPAQRAIATGEAARDRALLEDAHDTRTAAILGIALGVSFAVCFGTGLISHLIQSPTWWFHWSPRPAGLYRFTQGLHVATGLATIPLLLAKLWSVFPNLFKWPPFESAAHAIERAALVPLVCGAVFMLFSGAANIAKWYPWHFPFPVAHYWIAWITIGALIAHIGAKLATTRDVLSRKRRAVAVPATSGMSRRAYLTLTAASVGAVTLTTLGQTVRPLRRIALLAPRRPDIGPQGLPVNAVATGDIRRKASDAAYRLRVLGDVDAPLEFTLAELRTMPQHEARLPIACVEGWSATADWRGVRVRDLLKHAGIKDGSDVELVVHSLQSTGAYNHSVINTAQAWDRDTLVALEVNGETLHPDHGFPCRLIGPNRPGVQQTKWLRDITVKRT